MTDAVANVLMGLLVVSMLLAAIRLCRGPSLPDRVVALDLMAILGVSFCALFGAAQDEDIYLDVAIILALISFVGTVAFAYYLERRVET